jgi:hypothetical protein
MKKEILKCEFCNKIMTQKEHNFCDICEDCRDPNKLD